MKCPLPTLNPELGPECVDPEACQTGMPCHIVRPAVATAKDTPVSEEFNPDALRLADQLRDWWMNRAEREVEAVAPKAIEYGATDLAEIGRTMGLILGRSGLSHEEATEIGIYFYVLGKLARWTAAIREGRRVSDDTLHDIAVYIKMEQRNRDVGGWPFSTEEN